MATPYVRPTLAGYNASPPPDDGSAGSGNVVEWSKHKQKLGDPLKAFMEAVDSNVADAFAKRFGNAVRTDNTNATLSEDDEGKLVSVTGNTTITLPDATSVSSDWIVMIRNNGSNTVTVTGNGAQTVNGSASISLAPGASAIAVSNGANFLSFHNPGPLTANANGRANMADGFVVASKLASNSVETAKINNSAVTSAKINDNAVTTSKINNSAVTSAKLALNSVGQGALITATGDVTMTRVDSSGGDARGAVLPGGQYAFYPQTARIGGSGGSDNTNVAAFVMGGWGGSDGSTPSVRVGFIDATGTAQADYRAISRYIPASPPYDHGDGPVHGYVYVMLSAMGEFRALYAADDPPWYGNTRHSPREQFIGEDGKVYGRFVRPACSIDDLRQGRTSLEAFRAECGNVVVEEEEITMQTKLRGQEDLPRPFQPGAGETVVLIDPMDDLAGRLLEMMKVGESIGELFLSDYLRVDNARLEKRHGPPGVAIHTANWKLTK